jgi:DNA-binding NarL/FixJ family response regulator
MDVRMPVLDGIGATTLIKGASPAIRVVLITAYEQLELTAAGRECGADAFVYKGISGAELTERLRAAVFSPRPVEAA